MDFIEVIEALKTIKRYCQERTDCKCCRLHNQNDNSTCGVCPNGVLPARWEFDVDAEITVPSIFK
nr:MAG TPA: hypothetical protein [Caudoviricetes sp.]